MTRREEKMRADKEKMMLEEDPDKQRRLEVQHHKFPVTFRIFQFIR